MISQPRAVSALMQKDCTVQYMACSEAATVITTSRGDVFALYQYQCRRIVSKYVYSITVLCNCCYLSHCYSIACGSSYKITCVTSLCWCLSVLSWLQFLTHFDETWQRCLEQKMNGPFHWGQNQIGSSPFHSILPQILHIRHLLTTNLA